MKPVSNAPAVYTDLANRLKQANRKSDVRLHQPVLGSTHERRSAAAGFIKIYTDHQGNTRSQVLTLATHQYWRHTQAFSVSQSSRKTIINLG